MAKKEILVAYGVHVDAVAGWLGSYGGEDSPDDISRGMFAGEVGIPRMLKFFKKYNIPASIPQRYLFFSNIFPAVKPPTRLTIMYVPVTTALTILSSPAHFHIIAEAANNITTVSKI